MGSVEGLLDGKTGVMAGVIGSKLVFTSLDDAINKTKPLREDLLKLVEVLNT